MPDASKASSYDGSPGAVGSGKGGGVNGNDSARGILLVRFTGGLIKR